MKVYIPVWFQIKCNPSAEQGAKHLHQLILKSQFLPEKYCTIVTDASATVMGVEARDGLIRSKLEERKKLPRFETRKDYLI